MFLLCFHGFLRTGEITTSCVSSSTNKNLLTLVNINLDVKGRNVPIIFHHFKRKSSVESFQLQIQATGENYCRVMSVAFDLDLRGDTPDPLFLVSGNTVTRDLISDSLQKLLAHVGYDVTRYKSHNFRISAISRSFSHPQVQVMGSWKYDAYEKYIRAQSFKY